MMSWLNCSFSSPCVRPCYGKDTSDIKEWDPDEIEKNLVNDKLFGEAAAAAAAAAARAAPAPAPYPSRRPIDRPQPAAQPSRDPGIKSASFAPSAGLEPLKVERDRGQQACLRPAYKSVGVEAALHNVNELLKARHESRNQQEVKPEVPSGDQGGEGVARASSTDDNDRAIEDVRNFVRDMVLLPSPRAALLDRMPRNSSRELRPESKPEVISERPRTWSEEAEKAAQQGILRRQEAEKAAALEQMQLEQQRCLEQQRQLLEQHRQPVEPQTTKTEPAQAAHTQAASAPAGPALGGDTDEKEELAAAYVEKSIEDEDEEEEEEDTNNNKEKAAGIKSWIRKRTSELGERLPLWNQSGAENSFFFYAKGAFMSREEAPDGQSWADHCSPVAPSFAGDKTLIGRWADCMRAAVLLENAARKWKDDPAYSGSSPTDQVVQHFEACGHSDHVGALQNAKKAYRSALEMEADDGISSSRCSSRSVPDSVSVVSTNPCE